MRISVFGLGYVGCVTAACLAKEGHRVIGVDIDERKIEEVNRGRPPVIEPGLERLAKTALKRKRLIATDSAEDAVANSAVSLVCVGTPSNANGSLNLDYVKRVCSEIGKFLDGYHVVAIRSTVLPGSTEETFTPLLERTSGMKAFMDFGICVNPEFMREGSAVHDFYHPGRIVIGQGDKRSGDAVARIYRSIRAPVVRTSIRTAEMVKYADNAFHALKISFANEIGAACKRLGMDSRELMEIFCMDKNLNISPRYLQPGLAFGGSCLPKDLRALTHKLKMLDVETPVLASILPSNARHVERSIELILAQGKKKIGIFGLSFKAGTDDIRESPAIEIAERLMGKGCQVQLYDEDIALQDIFGSNRAYLENKIPHISMLLNERIEDIIENSEVLVLTKKGKNYSGIPRKMKEGQILVDLVRAVEPGDIKKNKYVGICW